MKKRAISPVMATLALILLGATVAGIVFFFASRVVYLSPPPTEELCRELNFASEIYKESGQFKLAIVNRGNRAIGGFSIKETLQGSITNREEVSLEVQSGRTESAILNSLTNADINKELLVAPKIIVDEVTQDILNCPEEFALRTRVRAS